MNFGPKSSLLFPGLDPGINVVDFALPVADFAVKPGIAHAGQHRPRLPARAAPPARGPPRPRAPGAGVLARRQPAPAARGRRRPGEMEPGRARRTGRAERARRLAASCAARPPAAPASPASADARDRGGRRSARARAAWRRRSPPLVGGEGGGEQLQRRRGHGVSRAPGERLETARRAARPSRCWPIARGQQPEGPGPREGDSALAGSARSRSAPARPRSAPPTASRRAPASAPARAPACSSRSSAKPRRAA